VPILETLAIALISICVGAICATRLRVTIIVAISVLALLGAGTVAVLFQDWSVALRIVMVIVLIQVSYLTVSAFGQSRKGH
jgi:hypothetical protein